MFCFSGYSQNFFFFFLLFFWLIIVKRRNSLLFLNPFVLLTDLLFLLRGEVVLDVEGLPDLFGCVATDHVGNCLAPKLEKRLVIQEVGGKNEFEKLVLRDLHKVGIPPRDLLAALLFYLLFRKRRVVLVVLTVFYDLVKHRRRDIAKRQSFITLFKAVIVNHGGDGLAHFGDRIRHLAVLIVTCLELHGSFFFPGHGDGEDNQQRKLLICLVSKINR